MTAYAKECLIPSRMRGWRVDFGGPDEKMNILAATGNRRLRRAANRILKRRAQSDKAKKD